MKMEIYPVIIQHELVIDGKVVKASCNNGVIMPENREKSVKSFNIKHREYL
jgi:hypothetical protein